MPIFVSAPLNVPDQAAFQIVDRLVTGFAFRLHNEYGRYLDEKLYQAELANRLIMHRCLVDRRLQMTLMLDDFRKDYYADLLVNAGVIVETKTADSLTGPHEAQLLNYLFMCGLRHGTLLNLRPERVQHRFVSTSLTLEQRRHVLWDTIRWKSLSSSCELLRRVVCRAFEDWGARLDLNAYRDAVVHFLGGEEAVRKEVEIHSNQGVLGRQNLWLLTPEIAFSFTASVGSASAIFEHQRRFLQHTNLRAIQWVHLHGQTVTLHTIERR